MIFIVRGNQAERREAVDEGEPVMGQNVQEARFPVGTVIVIAGDDGHGDGHEQLPNIKHRLPSLQIPLQHEKGRSDRHIGKRTAVGFVGKNQN